MADSWERRIQRLAWTRDGIVTRRALHEAGVSPSIIDRLIATGFLTPVHRGVYAVGWPRPTDRGTWRAALLAGGDGAVLSHRTAGALFGVLPAQRTPVHVTVPSRRRSVPGITWHVSPVPDRSSTVRDGFSCVTLARALVEIAGTDGCIAAERAWGTAASSNLLQPKDIAFEVARGRGTAGVGIIRELLGVHDGYLVQRARSELERAALRLLKAHRVPRPAANRLLVIADHRFEGDLLWPHCRFIAEVDGRGPHQHRASFDVDRERQAVLNLAGWRVTRVTYDDVHRRPGGTIDRIRAHLAQRPLEPAPGASAARFLRRTRRGSSGAPS